MSIPTKTIALVGKSTVPVQDPAYKFIKELAYNLVASGYAIRHGGYGGGIMDAAAEGAALAILENNLHASCNIGVPESRFDVDYARVKSGVFLEPARDICDRLRSLVLSSNYMIVAPRGGDGTMLELQLALHENLVRDAGRARPIILCELPGGTRWSDILDIQLNLLDNDTHSLHNHLWVHVAHSVKEIIDLLAFYEASVRP